MQRLIRFVVAAAAMCGAVCAEEESPNIRGVSYRTFSCQPEEVRVFWKDDAGNPYGNFARLNAALAARGERLVFAMNGGIFEPGGIPTGVHVEDGKMLRPLNLEAGPGNFFLKPNGVFYVDSTGAHVGESSKFSAAGWDARVAVQSGPLLLDGGKVHPAFQASSTSRLHRNGVGILPDGRVFFAITDAGSRVNLYEFAEFFRSRGCKDALFLDGDISLMWTPGNGEPQAVNHFAAMFGVVAAGDR